MKKGILVIALFLTMLAATLQAAGQPGWVTTYAQAKESKGYVYAVGVAEYDSKTATDDVYIKALITATKDSSKRIKTFLKIATLRDFQIIAYDYSNKKLYVLGAVPKERNLPTQIEMNRVYSTLEANKITRYHSVPRQWWRNYHPLPKKGLTAADYKKNVFRVGNNLYAIGYGRVNEKAPQNQYWRTAERAATLDAQRNLTAVLNHVLIELNDHEGNYSAKISGVLQGARKTNRKYEQSPNGCYVLMAVPLASIQ